MSTVDKLIYLNTTKTKLRNVINITGANLTEENTFRSYASNLESKLVDIINNGTDTLYNNFPKVVETGSEVELDNTYSSKMSVVLNADTKQWITTGKNLLNVNSPNTVSGITTIYNAVDGSLNVRGTATTTGNIQLTMGIPLYLTAGKTYTFSIDKPLPGSIYIHGYDENDDTLNIQISTGNTSKTSTLSRNIVRYNMRFPVTNGTTYNLTIKCQVEEGEEATEYEPYTGTIPGPSPDYPQKVQVITGSNNIKISNSDNTEEQNYPITLTYSKNLFNKDTAVYKNGYYITNSGNESTSSISGYTTSYTKVNPNTTYTISGSIRTTNATGAIYYYTNSKNWIERISWSGDDNTSLTFTTPNNCYYIQIQYTQSVIDGGTIQIEEGSSATSYQSFNSLEYCKIGNYADKFIRTSGKNLFDKNSATYRDGYYINNSGQETSSASIGYTNSFVEVEAGKTYTISGTFSDDSGFFRIYYYDSTQTFLSKTEALSVTTGSYTFTPVTNCTYIQFQYKVGSLNANTVQIEKSSSATEYEPYGINEWYLKKNINKVVLNGSENWQQFQTNVYVPNIFPAGISDDLVINGYCDKCFTNTNTNISYNGNAKTGLLIYNLVSFWGLTDTTPATWKTYLTNNNLTLYYPLATPTYTHISQESYPTLKGQLDNLYNNAISYNGTTNIIQINDDLPFILNTSALAKTE